MTLMTSAQVSDTNGLISTVQPLKPVLKSIQTKGPADSPKSSSPSSDGEQNLRILIVDDNFINLRVLSTLLNRRFGPFLAHAPVAVDSGLKAIQQLRTQVFDIIFMDIQMPFLSGVECTKRIRAGEHDILPANSIGTTICAVTSCTGSEASSLYRQSGFNGLIAKPVKFQEMSDFIIPLSKEAFLARDAVAMISPLHDGHFCFPPLPPRLPDNERAFFDATATPATTPQKATGITSKPHTRSPTLDEELLEVKNGQSSAASISNSSNFALLLEAETRASLKREGAVLTARTGTISGSPSPFLASHWRRNSRGSGSSNELPNIAKYDKEVFAAQVAQELQAATFYDSDRGSVKVSSLPSTHADEDQVILRANDAPVHQQIRPPCHHRLSSPAFMVDSPSTDPDSSDSDFENARPVIQVTGPRVPKSTAQNYSTAVRPSIRPLSRRPDFKFRSRSTTTTCTSLSFCSQDGESYRDWNHSLSNRSRSNSSITTETSITTTVDDLEDHQLRQSPLSTFLQKPFDQERPHANQSDVKMDKAARDGDGDSDHQTLSNCGTILRHDSVSTIDDDSPCSTPDEGEAELPAAAHFTKSDSNGTISRHFKGRPESLPHPDDLKQRLVVLKEAFHRD